MSKRADLSPLGWFVVFLLYCAQAYIFMMFLVEHTGNTLWYWIGTVVYTMLFVIAVCVASDLNGRARKDEDVSKVWCIWLLYIVTFIVSVALIFFKVAEKLDPSHWLSPNLLKSVLCITPALLVLLPQLMISRTHRKSVLSLSVFGALNIFDGIEMLEIVLMKKERQHFDLGGGIETAIIVSALLSFLVTSVGFTRNKLVRSGKIVINRVYEDENPVSPTLMEVLFTNVSFLVLRFVVWYKFGYEAAIFIAKNIISLGIGVVEFWIAGNC